MRRALLTTTIATVICTWAAPAHAAAPLAGTSWEFERMAGRALEPDYDASLRFGRDGIFGGRNACNSIGGHYRAGRVRLRFARTWSTLVGCESEGRGHDLFGVLHRTRAYRRTARRLVLIGAGGRVLARLARER